MLHSSLPVLRLAPQRARPFWAGHPVVRRTSLADIPSLAPGSFARLVDDRGKEVGLVLFEGREDIAAWLLSRPAARVWARGSTDDAAREDAFAALLRRAVARRASVAHARTLVAAEADDLPGLELRRFDDAVAGSVRSAALAAHATPLAAAIGRVFERSSVFVVPPNGGRAYALGEAGPSRLMERGVSLVPLAWARDAPGWSQRTPIRSWVAALASERTVVDLLGTDEAAAQAHVAGARHVVTCEREAEARAVDERSLGAVERLARAPDSAAQTLFDQGARFDLVVGSVPATQQPKDARRVDQRVWNLLRLVAHTGGTVLAWSDDEGRGDAPLVASAAHAAGRLGVRVSVRAVVRTQCDVPSVAAHEGARRWTLVVLDVEGSEPAGDVE
jgi:hypothetical protein